MEDQNDPIQAPYLLLVGVEKLFDWYYDEFPTSEGMVELAEKINDYLELNFITDSGSDVVYERVGVIEISPDSADAEATSAPEDLADTLSELYAEDKVDYLYGPLVAHDLPASVMCNSDSQTMESFFANSGYTSVTLAGVGLDLWIPQLTNFFQNLQIPVYVLLDLCNWFDPDRLPEAIYEINRNGFLIRS